MYAQRLFFPLQQIRVLLMGNLVLGMEQISGEEGKVGSKARLKYLHGKREIELIEAVDVDNLPDEYTGTYETKGMRMTVRNLFKEDGPDRTKWISENEAEVSGLMMTIMAKVMPGCFKKQSWIYMENFKAFAEEGKDLRKLA